MSKEYLILEALDTEDRISEMIERLKPYEESLNW